MLRAFGLVVGGMFVGVAGVEVMRKKYPEALQKLHTTVEGIAAGVKEGFKEGFGKAAKPQSADPA